MTNRALLSLFALFALVIAGCAPSAAPITGPDRDAVLSYSETKIDRLLQGLNDADYAVFAKDMDAKMKAALSAQSFPQMRSQVVGKIGKYISRSLTNSELVGGYVRNTYTAKFEQEDGVSILVVFDKSNQLISGLFFNSPKLKGQ